MADDEERMHASAARERESRTFHRVRAGRVATADQRVLEQLRQVGRDMLDERVPQSMVDILRTGQDLED